jgi:hypothetical protein
LIKILENQEAMVLSNTKRKEISIVLNSYLTVNYNLHFVIVAIEKGNGRRVDGRRVICDYERGRTKSDWIPRKLGGGRGDTRRDRDEEKMIRELKKTEPALKEKSRS